MNIYVKHPHLLSSCNIFSCKYCPNSFDITGIMFLFSYNFLQAEGTFDISLFRLSYVLGATMKDDACIFGQHGNEILYFYFY